MAKIVVSSLERTVMLPIVRTSRRFWMLVAGLLAVIGWGLYAYSVQLQQGLTVTGLHDRISWGLYIGTFVFFIGVSYGGTLVSAILRITNAEWRKPITRLAEATTAFALLIAVAMIMVDLGRPERAWELFAQGRIDSPLLWDLIVVTLYLVGSLIYLFLPMIPDLAILRAKLPSAFRRHRTLYRLLSSRWHGLPEQRKALARALGAMTILIIPVAVAAHTVTAWIFSMTLRVGWHSALLGPYFVVGAIFSGLATVVLVIAVGRKALHLESLIKPVHFRNLGWLLVVLDLVLLYFTLSEYFTALYGGESADVAWLALLTTGTYSTLFWAMVFGGFLAPAGIIVATRSRSILWTAVAAILVNVGMWIERFLIVVSTMGTPQMPAEVAAYWPTWVEWSLMAAAVAGFALFLTVFCKLFPAVGMAELKEGAPKAAPTPAEKKEEVVT